VKKITLEGEPRSTSTIYKYHCRTGFASGYMSEEGKKLKEDYQWQVKSQWKDKIIPEGKEVIIEMHIHFGTKRKQDIDNFSKLALDALSGIVFEDDSQIFNLNIAKFYDKARPRIELKINTL
jgi:Holliday junction resolvase RusA-like endonuclease